MAKLKVFRTTIGFHDAYVAAPSRAAALRAWGASTDLFAMGAAEEVIEPALMKAPLAHAGSIIKQSRGPTAEHMATASASAHSRLKASKPKVAIPKPLPSRRMLDAAEKKLGDAEAKFERVKDELDDEAARLATRRRAIEHEHRTRIAGLTDDRNKEAEAHRDLLDRWRAE